MWIGDILCQEKFVYILQTVLSDIRYVFCSDLFEVFITLVYPIQESGTTLIGLLVDYLCTDLLDFYRPLFCFEKIYLVMSSITFTFTLSSFKYTTSISSHTTNDLITERRG